MSETGPSCTTSASNFRRGKRERSTARQAAGCLRGSRRARIHDIHGVWRMAAAVASRRLEARAFCKSRQVHTASAPRCRGGTHAFGKGDPVPGPCGIEAESLLHRQAATCSTSALAPRTKATPGPIPATCGFGFTSASCSIYLYAASTPFTTSMLQFGWPMVARKRSEGAGQVGLVPRQLLGTCTPSPPVSLQTLPISRGRDLHPQSSDLKGSA